MSMVLWTNGRVHLADKPLDARYRLFQAHRGLPAANSSAAAARLGRYRTRDQAALKRLTPLIEQNRPPPPTGARLAARGDYRGNPAIASAASPKDARRD